MRRLRRFIFVLFGGCGVNVVYVWLFDPTQTRNSTVSGVFTAQFQLSVRAQSPSVGGEKQYTFSGGLASTSSSAQPPVATDSSSRLPRPGGMPSNSNYRVDEQTPPGSSKWSQCKVCLQRECTQAHLQGWRSNTADQKQQKCSIWTSIDYDLHHWKDKSVTLKSIWSGWEFLKGVAISWDGQKLRMVSNPITLLSHSKADIKNKTFLRDLSLATNTPLSSPYMPKHKPQNRRGWLQALDLVARVIRQAGLPPMEFLVHWSDNAQVHKPMSQPPPVFGISKTQNDFDILFPSVIRRQGSEMSLRNDLNIFERSVPWEAKIEKLFWRGMTSGIRTPQDARINPRRTLSCLHRQGPPNYAQVSDVVDAGFPRAPSEPAWLRDLATPCRSPYVAYNSSDKYKYLAILAGTGNSGRFKDFLTAESLVIKYFRNPQLYEWWEGGLQNGIHIFDVGAAPVETVANLVRWAQSHDENVRSMVKRANAYQQWSHSNQTMDCYVWQLLRLYARKLAYDVKGGLVAQFFKDRPLEGQYFDEIRLSVPPAEAQLVFAERCRSLMALG